MTKIINNMLKCIKVWEDYYKKSKFESEELI